MYNKQCNNNDGHFWHLKDDVRITNSTSRLEIRI